jgi:hypothetical protein
MPSCKNSFLLSQSPFATATILPRLYADASSTFYPSSELKTERLNNQKSNCWLSIFLPSLKAEAPTGLHDILISFFNWYSLQNENLLIYAWIYFFYLIDVCLIELIFFRGFYVHLGVNFYWNEKNIIVFMDFFFFFFQAQ